MKEPTVVGVFGISGVGKSMLIAKTCEEVPYSLHLKASTLIKQGLTHTVMRSEEIWRRTDDQILFDQDILVDRFWQTVHEQDCQLILFDGHLVLDTDDRLFEIPHQVIGQLNPSQLVHVEDDVAKIAARRLHDTQRKRPILSKITLTEHQRASQRLCATYAHRLGIGMQVLRPDEVERFRKLLRELRP